MSHRAVVDGCYWRSENVGEVFENPVRDIIRPHGLVHTYDEIRPFTAERCHDITTPLPSVPKTRRRQVADVAVSSDSDDAVIPPPPSRGPVHGRGGHSGRGGRVGRGRRGTTV